MIAIKEKIELYEHNFTLLIGSHEEEREYLLKYHNCKDDLEDDPNHGAVFYDICEKGTQAKTHSFIWMPKFIFSIEDYKSLMHECVHAAYSLCGSCNLPVTPDNNENLAYISSYLFARFLDKLTKLDKKKKDAQNGSA